MRSLDKMEHQAYHSKNLVHGAGNSGISPGINTLSWSNLSNMTASEGGPRADGMEFGVVLVPVSYFQNLMCVLRYLQDCLTES